MTEKTVSAEAKRAELEAREKYLLDAITKLRKTMRRAPWGLTAIALTLPVGLLWGTVAAATVFFAAVMFSCAMVYIAWVHFHECEIELSAVRGSLKSKERRS